MSEHPTSHWPLLCDPAEKAEREADNSVKQLEYIDHLVSERHILELRESHVLELQSLAIEGIYPCGGRYRNAVQDVRIHNSPHQLPEPAFVQTHVREALEALNVHRREWSTIHRAAYAMWRVNWIHPFAGGNGRTARALAYLVVCMDHGAMLPGVPSMPHLIARERDAYIQALQSADSGELTSGAPDLRLMEELLRRVLVAQASAALSAATE